MKKLFFEIMWVLFLVGALALVSDIQIVNAEVSWIWVRNTTTGAYGEAVVGTGTSLYIARGTKFYQYLPDGNVWTEMAVPPNPDAGDAFKTGTALAWNFGDFIYALYGAATSDNRRWFYRYSISSNSWEALANTTADQGEGDAIAWVDTENCIYATIGGEQRSTYFMRYNPSTNSWSDAPADPPDGMGDGASLVWTGGNYLYALRGEFLEDSPLYDFWRYSLIDNVWVAMADIPAVPHGVGSGGVGDSGSLLYVGSWLSDYTDCIYALSGNQAYPENPAIPDNRTYRYMISTNIWERLADLPFGVGHYVGCRLGYADGYIYAWQGAPSTWTGGGDDLAKYKLPRIDSNPPTTAHNYDGLWHTADFTISLIATDDISGVNQTYYKINSDTTKTVSINGHPHITAESANNTLEYWSVDNADNEELPHKTLIGTKLDKTPPAGSITINSGATYTNSTSVTPILTATDATSGVYQVRFSNDGIWDTEPWEPPLSIKTWALISGDGTKRVYYQIKDNAGLVSNIYADDIILDTADPLIGIPSQMPEDNVKPYEEVKVSANVTDFTSHVKDVILSYNLNNGTVWVDSPMTFNPTTGLYETIIQGQQANTFVKYRITAYDNAENVAIENNAGRYYTYIVIPEFPFAMILPLFMVLTMLTVIFAKKRFPRK